MFQLAIKTTLLNTNSSYLESILVKTFLVSNLEGTNLLCSQMVIAYRYYLHTRGSLKLTACYEFHQTWLQTPARYHTYMSHIHDIM